MYRQGASETARKPTIATKLITVTTLWSIKTNQKFFHHNLKKSDPILISIGRNISDTTDHRMTVLVSHLTHCLFLHYLRKNEQNIAFLTTLALLLDQQHNNTHFVHIFIILGKSLSNCRFFNWLEKSLKCWPTNMGSARKHFLYSLIAALITFCSRPIQTSPVTSWIHQYSWMLCLFHRRAAAQQSNLVIDWLLVATYPERWNF